MPGTAANPDFRNHGENQIFGDHSLGRVAVEAHLTGFRLVLQQALGGEHVLDFRRADAKCQRPKGPVGRRMAIAADDGHARLREPQLGADDVHNPLVFAVQVLQGDPELAAVDAHLLDLLGGD